MARKPLLESLYEFAPVPDLVIYLDIDVETLIPRVLKSTGFTYWESGQDYLSAMSVFESFVAYQTQLLDMYRQLAAKHGFRVVDARGSIPEVLSAVSAEIETVLEGMASEHPAG